MGSPIVFSTHCSAYTHYLSLLKMPVVPNSSMSIDSNC